MGKTTVDKGEGNDNDDDNNDAYADYDDDNDNEQESIDPYKEKVEDDSTNMPSPIPPVAAAGKTAVDKTAATTAKKKKDPTGVAGITQKCRLLLISHKWSDLASKLNSPSSYLQRGFSMME